MKFIYDKESDKYINLDSVWFVYEDSGPSYWAVFGFDRNSGCRYYDAILIGEETFEKIKELSKGA